MTFGKQIPDNTLLKSVNQKLMRRSAGGSSKVSATVSSGTVTLAGVLGQEYERRLIISSMNGVQGIRRVIDRMTVSPPKKRV